MVPTTVSQGAAVPQQQQPTATTPLVPDYPAKPVYAAATNAAPLLAGKPSTESALSILANEPPSQSVFSAPRSVAPSSAATAGYPLPHAALSWETRPDESFLTQATAGTGMAGFSTSLPPPAVSPSAFHPATSSGQTTPPPSEDRCNVYVRNISPRVTAEELRQLFDPFGEVVSHKLMVDIRTGAPRGFGFVLFKRPQDAAASVSALDGFAVHGRELNVRLADSKTRQPGEATNRVFLRNLPPSISEDELVRLCSAEGGVVQSCILRRDDRHGHTSLDGQGHTFTAHVEMKDVTSAAALASRLNNSEMFMHMVPVPLQAKVVDSTKKGGPLATQAASDPARGPRRAPMPTTEPMRGHYPTNVFPAPQTTMTLPHYGHFFPHGASGAPPSGAPVVFMGPNGPTMMLPFPQPHQHHHAFSTPQQPQQPMAHFTATPGAPQPPPYSGGAPMQQQQPQQQVQQPQAQRAPVFYALPPQPQTPPSRGSGESQPTLSVAPGASPFVPMLPPQYAPGQLRTTVGPAYPSQAHPHAQYAQPPPSGSPGLFW